MTLLEQCRKFLRYEAETGHFYWQNRRKDHDGKRAGYVSTKGYRQIKLCDVAQMEHRLAWLMTYGELPSDQIDHRNEIKSDNRINNLRDATNQTNRLFVAKANGDNKSSGVRGVHRTTGFDGSRGGRRWQAHIRRDHKLIYLGVHPTIEIAAECYNFAKQLILESIN